MVAGRGVEAMDRKAGRDRGAGQQLVCSSLPHNISSTVAAGSSYPVSDVSESPAGRQSPVSATASVLFSFDGLLSFLPVISLSHSRL